MRGKASRKTEPKVTSMELRRLVKAVARPAHLGEGVHAPPSNSPVPRPRRSFCRRIDRERILHCRATVGIGPKRVRAPLPDIAVHVVKAEPVRLEPPDVVEVSIGVLAVPRMSRQVSLA